MLTRLVTDPGDDGALAIYEAVLGAQHPDVAVVSESYAALLRATDRAEEAEKFVTRAQTIRANHP